ncbi:hypothetical protein OH76DRAFT_930634 [Lentinus brumalis]|uniref:Uncharacterized protein n=1 Tax=Lentinus brumalis TaxID=2498619 RepID=A0A371CZV6_9APHY|nr:hypothetical protein OH76DRAFT_930634 [Polyporus brumalis]
MSSTMPSLSSSSSAPSPPPGQSLSPPSRPTPTGGNQNAFPAGPGLQLTSSASLYLYTFLGTLRTNQVDKVGRPTVSYNPVSIACGRSSSSRVSSRAALN